MRRNKIVVRVKSLVVKKKGKHISGPKQRTYGGIPIPGGGPCPGGGKKAGGGRLN